MPSVSEIRGAAAPCRHNARTIAALTTNPGCTRRAVLDTAGVDKQQLSSRIGFPARFGQSRFAIVRGNSFEAHLKANGCAELLRALREDLGFEITQAEYLDLGTGMESASPQVRSRGSAARLTQAAGEAAGPVSEVGTLLDHPLLILDVAGQPVYLEPDLIAFRNQGRFHIVEIKSFAVIDGQADPAKVAAAAIQSAVYVLAVRRCLERAGFAADLVSDRTVLVCPENFANRPVATLIDVRPQLAVIRRQLARMSQVDSLLRGLPEGLTFALDPDSQDHPTRPAAELVAALEAVPARYAPQCQSHCELAGYCREGAGCSTASLGLTVREQLGGIDDIEMVLGLASGRLAPAPEQQETAAMLRLAAKLREEALAAAGLTSGP